MRFHRPTDDSSREIRHPRVLFFLLGPFYLLWLRLWQDAVVMGVGLWLLMHGVTTLARSALGVRTGLHLGKAFAAADSVRAGAARGIPAEAAFRELMGMLLPYYAAGFALLAFMAVLTPLFPRYLAWRLARSGWQRSTEDLAEKRAAAQAK